MTDIFDEVEQDYHAAQLRQAATKYAWVAAAALIVVLLGVGGWRYWHYRQTQADAAAAASYLDAAKLVEARHGPAAAERFGALARATPAGYATLARLRQAGLEAEAGHLAQAQALWQAVSVDPRADVLLRQMASLLWVQRGLDSADPAALRTRLVSLTASDNPFRPLAHEAEALLDLRLGQPAAARKTLLMLDADPATPEGVRGRAGALLARLGGS